MTEDWTDKLDRYCGMNAAPQKVEKVLPYDPAEDDLDGCHMNEREKLLFEANDLVNGDRNNQYGPPDQGFTRAAAIATAMGYTGPDGRELRAHDIALIVIGVKMSRLVRSPEKRDSWVDIAGYAACGYECVVGESGEV